MRKSLLTALTLGLLGCQASVKKEVAVENPVEAQARGLLSSIRQFTYDGKRSGEGYFNADGSQMIFQSEREDGNPFYQMYVQNMSSGEVRRVSPGMGKTTCGWIHPSNKKVLFSSTHHDPEARKKQKDELDFRASGKTRRYSWDYDENYDIFESDIQGKKLRNLTRVRGYDAEGAYSPDGQWIVFASNRHAYSQKLDEADQKRFEQDFSYMLDIYIMKADGTGVRRLTDHKGYDGGPFFSPDGSRVVWRRFSADGHTAEVFTMKTDGSDVRQITRLKAMSWAPFYHPSGDYLIFTTNLLGYGNFELYIVDAEGKSEPIRASFADGFDGLPVFHPNGRQVFWSRNTGGGAAQIHVADWDDTLARKLLGLAPVAPDTTTVQGEIRAEDLQKWVRFFASHEMKGRATGSEEEIAYGAAVAKHFQKLGLAPAGEAGTFYQKFDFQKSLKLGAENTLSVDGPAAQTARLNQDWRPLAGPKGTLTQAGLAFAGYGIVAPADGSKAGYDSYSGVDVKDKWVLVFRYLPENVSTEMRAQLHRYSQIPFKAVSARSRGAKGLLIVSGPNAASKNPLVRLERSGLSGQMDIPVISVSDEFAERLLRPSGKSLKALQTELDRGSSLAGFSVPNITVSARIDIQSEKGVAQNVMGLLKVPGARHTLIVGAHGDHLGVGKGETSLMSNQDTVDIHFGADDNASGMAAVMELARYLSQPVVKNSLKQNVLFVIWSGEEIGTLGSQHFVKDWEAKSRVKSLSPNYSAYINMDMIGRLKDMVAIQGLGSSPAWAGLIERLGTRRYVAVAIQNDPYLPTDAMPLYLGGLPVASFFTGSHAEYHTPRDTEETLNYPGMERITRTIGALATDIATSPKPLPYGKVERDPHAGTRGGFRLFLGTIPDYSQTDVKGVLLSGVVKGGPAEQAGLRKGDVIVEFGKHKIQNIYDYVYSLQINKPNAKTTIVVVRDGKTRELEITPTSKE